MVPVRSEKIPGILLELKAFATRWFQYYVVWNKAAPFISGLILVHAWVEYALIAVLITHLTDDWLHLPKAASLVNVQDGVTAVLVLVVAYVSDAYLGPFLAVACTTVAYITGLILLFFAAWRLTSIELQLLYLALILVALGRAGRDIPLKEFLAYQFREEGSYVDEEQLESRRKIWWRPAYILGIGASVYVFANASWIELSKISAIAMAVAFMLFLGGIAFKYKYKPPANESKLNNLLRILYAAISKRHLGNSTPSGHVIPILRWLDKASVEEPSPSREEQVRKGRLWSTQDVQEVKILLSMVPLWTTFLVYGLLQATGNTFFYEQVGYMDNRLGRISNVPIVIFVIVKSSTSFIVSRLCDSLFPSYWSGKVPRQVMLTRIGVGMAISPVCCIVAWRVEKYRLQKYVNLDFSISVFWLIPQFFFLGFMEGLVSDGMEDVFDGHVPESFRKYGPSFTQFALNIGNFVSLAFILIFHGLFNDNLDTSGLATYYALLAYICFVNLLFYCCVATFYVKELYYERDESPVEEIEQELEQIQNLVDNHEGPTEVLEVRVKDPRKLGPWRPNFDQAEACGPPHPALVAPTWEGGHVVQAALSHLNRSTKLKETV
ncbi:protein NRT1/ PTR FAMILY 5.7 [Sesamum alatum]|uniref:Protein NRT1/ PTR FAMILY 5.7 n=1 Tax=Sesamum alatum TaxID=300844 RepID=A0AAE1YR48_9LAMI|nr:protein NRT1/ PTR FAMILY 5.7 [Sesamum alatum]